MKCVFIVCFLFCCWFLSATSMAAMGDIDETEKYAWSETSGWLNFRPSHGGVTVYDSHISGFVWAANIGWIKMGSDTGGPYENTSKNDWGVNRDGESGLYGYAWSENVGWINFKPSHGGVLINPDSGAFSGYAWGENVGWINFSSASYGLVTSWEKFPWFLFSPALINQK